MPFSPQLLAAARAQLEEPVRLVVSGSTFSDWFSVDIDSDIFIPADAFSFEAVIPETRYLKLFREGESVDVYIGDDRQMSGIIDNVEISIGRNGRIKVEGRDRACYLVDSEAKAEKFSHYSLKTLAEHLIQSEWRIKKVIADNNDNRKILLGKEEKERFKRGKSPAAGIGDKKRRQTKIDPGQTVAHILDQHCQKLGVTWWMTAQGDLFIGKPEYKQDPSYEFFLYKPGTELAQKKNNFLLEPGANIKRSITGRYSELTVVGQGGADGSAKSNPFAPETDDDKKAKKFKGTATDPDLVARGIKRKLIVIENDALSSEMCKAKADEDMQKRRLNAFKLPITAEGFKQNGKLFTTDTLAKVVIEEAGIDGEYWISQRRFVEDSGKRRTSMTLHEKGVYLP